MVSFILYTPSLSVSRTEQKNGSFPLPEIINKKARDERAYLCRAQGEGV